MLSSFVRSIQPIRQSIRISSISSMNSSMNKQRFLHTHFTAEEREAHEEMVLSDHSESIFSSNSQQNLIKMMMNQSNNQSNNQPQNESVKAQDYNGNDTTQSVMEAAGLHTHRLVAAEMVHHH